MASLRQVIQDFMPDEFPSAVVFCRRVSEKKIGPAIFKYKFPKPNTGEKLGSIFDLLRLGSEEAEDLALAIILGAFDSGELKFFINKITWDTLDDELDEPDLDRIAKRLGLLLERREYRVYSILRAIFFADPETGPDSDQVFGKKLSDIPISQITNIATALSASRRQVLADDFLARRDNLLDSIALVAFRGRPTNVRELRVVIDTIQNTGQHQPQQLLSLSWEVFYTELICAELERGEYRMLLQTLPDLVNPAFPAARRVAFLDMLRRWDRVFAAMEELVKAVGSIRQQSDMRRFMDTRRVFMDNFPAQPQQPNAIQQAIQAILNALNQVAGGLQDLVAAVQAIAQSIADLSVPGLLGTTRDDIAVNATNGLFAQSLLALLPTDYKLELINRMLSGAAEDEEEQGALKILLESKKRSVAEFLQLVAGETWEKLDSNIDGQEHDDLEGLFVF